MAVVLGLDLSVVRCGLAVYDGDLRVVGTIRMDSDELTVARRHEVLVMVQRACVTYKVQAVCMEDVRHFFNARIPMQAISSLVALSTSVEDWCFGRFMPLVRVYPVTWRKVVLGNYRATKEDAVAFIRRRFGRVVGHDAAEAACLAIFGAMKQKGVEVAK